MISKNMINLCSLNVNGIHGREKRNRVVEWIKTQKCSIAFLQETHLDENIENEIKNKTNFAIYCSNGISASRGVGIVINKSLNYEIMDKFTDEDGRMILINIQIENTVFSMVSIYAPNCRTLRNVFFKNVSRFLKEHGTGIPIVGGDFNETLMPIDRKSKGKNGTFIQPVTSLKRL